MDKRSNSGSFRFWQNWLFYTSILFAMSGLAFAFFGRQFIFLPYDQMLATALWGTPKFPPQAEVFRAFIYVPFGGTIACCYLLLAFIAKYPFKEKKRWARNAIMIAFGVWVITDSTACFMFKIYPQIYLINAFSIFVKILPIVFTWKEFRSSN